MKRAERTRGEQGEADKPTGVARSRRLAAQAMLLFFIVLALSSCGKKGVPQPPPDEPNTFPRTYPSA